MKELPNATRNPEWPVIGEPFILKFFYNNSVTSEHRPPFSAETFQKKLTQYVRVQARYAILLMQTGAELERSIRILETKRKLRVSHLRDRINFIRHPVAQSIDIRKHILAVEKVKVLEDTVYLRWYNILSGLIFQVSEALQHFMVCSRMAALPQFTDVMEEKKK